MVSASAQICHISRCFTAPASEKLKAHNRSNSLKCHGLKTNYIFFWKDELILCLMHKMKMEHLSYDEMLRELELLSLEKTRLWGDLIAALQCVKRPYRKDGEGLYLQGPGVTHGKITSNGTRIG